MRRDVRQFTALLMCVLTLASGCAPTQPFFYHEDGDLSHYKGVATEVEYTEVCQQTSNDIETTKAPLTDANSENFQTWDRRL